MPWLDDMQALSTAMTQQGPRGQAQMAQAAPPPLPPRPVSEDVQGRTSTSERSDWIARHRRGSTHMIGN
jgi:hypothetical protein